MASSDSQINKPQRGRPKRAEPPDVNINTGAQSSNTERASFKSQCCCSQVGRFDYRRLAIRSMASTYGYRRKKQLPVNTVSYCLLFNPFSPRDNQLNSPDLLLKKMYELRWED